jgi:MFS family permease
MSLIISPLATISVRELGTKPSLLIGVALETAGLLGASWATEIWHLFLSQGLAFGFGMGFLFVTSVGVVPQWFDKKRSFANSISAAGSGFGGMIYSLASNAMIQSIGLGWAFRVLAILAFVVNIVCTILIRDVSQVFVTSAPVTIRAHCSMAYLGTRIFPETTWNKVTRSGDLHADII